MKKKKVAPSDDQPQISQTSEPAEPTAVETSELAEPIAVATSEPVKVEVKVAPFPSVVSVACGSEECSVATKSTQILFPDPNKEKMRARIRSLERKCKELKSEVWALKGANEALLNKLKKLKGEEGTACKCQPCRDLDKLPPHAKTFIMEQIHLDGKSTRGYRWANSTVEFGQFLLYKSPSCYNRLRGFFKMPSAKTLIRRAPETSTQVSFIHVQLLFMMSNA